ncbi:tail fiber domain-containing protein [Maribius pontilimi]|uniref:Tail fiber domain-containing protein n=1 Tax=Palleronia pontilimi TaxID=1964209 RepID=A0A934IH16_9RHOB|nr:tail fiber domain-containing protein [Palleronia pontilimi]MBJ3762440.1 tail fiber domain-containing protein [Palleronia pontilimi]
MSDVILAGDSLELIGREIRIRTPTGDTVVLSVNDGNLTLGGAGRDGDLMLTDRAGNLTIGLNGESGSLHLGGTTEDGDVTLYDRNTRQTVHMDGAKGDVTMSGTLVADRVVQISDATLKTDCQPIDGALSTLRSVTGYRYRFAARTQEQRLGFLAQDLRRAVPEAVRDSGDHLAVEHATLVPLLVEAVKELAAEVAELRMRQDGRSG